MNADFHVIQVNHSPSFTCDTPFDTLVKQTLISDVMTMLNVCA